MQSATVNYSFGHQCVAARRQQSTQQLVINCKALVYADYRNEQQQQQQQQQRCNHGFRCSCSTILLLLLLLLLSLLLLLLLLQLQLFAKKCSFFVCHYQQQRQFLQLLVALGGAFFVLANAGITVVLHSTICLAGPKMTNHRSVSQYSVQWLSGRYCIHYHQEMQPSSIA